MPAENLVVSDAETVDAVVVGAGHNGLVAANMLADRGWSVRVLEASDGPGGAVRTEEITAPGFRSDLGSAFYPMGVVSPAFRALDLEAHGLEWRHAPAPLAHVLPDDRGVLLSRDVDVTAASLDRFAPGDGDAWRRLADEWQRLRDPLLAAFLGPFPPVRDAARVLRTLGGPDALRLARRMLLPATRFGEEEFAGEGARVLLAGNALHTDLGVNQTASTAFGWLLAMLAQDVGFPVPAGGARGITDALVARLELRGGTVECHRPVTRVLVEGGRAVGVVDAAGGLVRARRAVLADVPAPVLFGDLVGTEHLPARMVDDLARFQYDDAILKVDWALSSPIPWTAPEPREAGTVHLGGDVAGLVDFGADLAAGRMPREPFMLLGQMTLADPLRSPPGTESVWAYTHLPHRRVHTEEELAEQVARMVAVHRAPRAGLRRARRRAGRVRARRPRGPQPVPGRRRAHGRHRPAAPDARVPPDARARAPRHPRRAPLPRRRDGPPGGRGARDAGGQRGAGGAGAGRATRRALRRRDPRGAAAGLRGGRRVRSAASARAGSRRSARGATRPRSRGARRGS